jgi:hypothetical protein
VLREAVLFLKFCSRPTLAAEVLRHTVEVALPAFAEARVASADSDTDVGMRERWLRHAVVVSPVRGHLRRPVGAAMRVAAALRADPSGLLREPPPKPVKPR